MPRSVQLPFVAAVALVACDISTTQVEVVYPATLAQSTPNVRSRLRGVLSIPGLLDPTELEILPDEGSARGNFVLANTSVENVEATLEFYASLSDELPEVLVARSRAPVSIREGEANTIVFPALTTSGTSEFDVNRNGDSNLSDLIAGVNPAPIELPLVISPSSVGFESGIELGEFSRSFVVLENTANDTVDVNLDVRLAPGVSIVPLEELFSIGGGAGGTQSQVVLEPDAERVFAVTFAPANPLFVVGRIAVNARVRSSGVSLGAAIRVLGNPDGAFPQVPSEYREVVYPDGTQVDTYSGPVSIYEQDALFSGTPIGFEVAEVDTGGIAATRSQPDGAGAFIESDVQIDVDAAYLVRLLARYRFSVVLDSLTDDVDAYLIPLDAAFQPAADPLDCRGVAGVQQCAERLGTSPESLAIDNTALESSEQLVLIALDRVDVAGRGSAARGVIQTSMYSVPEFLPPCAADDTACAAPVSSSEECPASYQSALACADRRGSTQITLRGRNFDRAATVRIASQTAICGTLQDGAGFQTLTCVSPPAETDPRINPSTAIVVTNPDGQTATLADGLTFLPPAPVLFSPLPSTGPTTGVLSVVISGANFYASDSRLPVVLFGDNEAEVLEVSPDGEQLRVILPACEGCGAVDVTVTNPDGQSATRLGLFTYQTPTAPPPSLTDISPATGAITGGTLVTLTGTNIDEGASVFFRGVPASVSSTAPLTVTTPAAGAGPVDVEVINPDGQTSRVIGGFIYVNQPPLLAAVTPSSGTQTGGTHVEISGTGFLPGALVLFGTVPCANATTLSAQRIVCTTQAASAGAVAVTVTNLDGLTVSRDAAFTFTPAAPPLVATVVPSRGPPSGGTVVSITGSSFQTGARVFFGSSESSSVSFISGGALSTTVPPGAAATVDVRVENPDQQTGALANSFTYEAPLGPPPQVFSVTPGIASPGGGTQITINGAQFDSAVSVRVGANLASVLTVDMLSTPQTITAITPAGAPSSSVTLGIQNPDGQQATLPFSYAASDAPRVVTTNPSAGEGDVPLSQAIIITMNEAIDPLTVTTDTVRVASPEGQVPGALETAGTTIIFVAGTPLLPSSLHTVTLTTGIRSVLGVPLDANVLFDFTTRGETETTPPTVTSVSPADGVTGVPVNSAISVVFSEPMDPDSINPATFFVAVGGNTATGEISYGGQQATLTISSDLPPLSLHTVTVTGGVRDLAGNPLGSNFVWTFTTADEVDLLPPAVVLTTPSQGATSVSAAATLIVLFNEDVDPSTVTASTFRLNDGVQNISGTVDATGTMASFAPTAPLTFDTEYTATLTSGVADLSGNNLDPDFVWSFTVEPPRPEVSSTQPINGATEIAVDATISATFNKTINGGTLDATTVMLQNGAGTLVPTALSFNGTDMVEIVPGSPELITRGTTYDVILSGGAGGIADPGGVTLLNDFTFSFTTVLPVWGAPTSIETITDEVIRPVPGITEGLTLVVYERTADSSTRSSTDVMGGGFSQAQLDCGPGNCGAQPNWSIDLDTATNGFAIASWTAAGGFGATSPALSYYDPSSGWQTQTNLSALTGSGGNSAVAISSDGSAFLTTVTRTSGEVTVARRLSQGLWERFETAVDGVGNGFSEIDADTQGRATVVYLAASGDIVFTRWDEGWSTAATAVAGTSGALGDPLVNVDGAGAARILFTRDDSGTLALYSSRFVTDWSTPELVSAGPTSTNTTDYRLAVVGNGDAIAVWAQNDGVAESIYANRFSLDGNSWGTPLTIESSNLGAREPDVAVDAAGNAYAVWLQNDGVNDSVFVSRYSVSANTWSVPELLETSGDAVATPRVAVSSQGVGVAVWSQIIGGISQIQAAQLQ